MLDKVIILLNVAKDLPSLRGSLATFDVRKLVVYQIEANNRDGLPIVPLIFLQHFGIRIKRGCAPLYQECPKHHTHKENPGVTPWICGAIGERGQVIIV